MLSEKVMMDRTLGGKRCRTIRSVSHHRGILPRKTTGTVRYSLENIGRTLFYVDFDAGPSLIMLPDDITFEAAEPSMEV